jgi:carbonic anhydrase
MAEPKVVEPADPSKKTSQILNTTSDEATVQMDQLKKNCYWNDEAFSQGDQIEVDGNCYECSFGRWVIADD